MAKIFQKLNDKHFAHSPQLKKLFSKKKKEEKLKPSYSCIKSIGKHHDIPKEKINGGGSDNKERRSCNFRVKEECPLKRARNDAAHEIKAINGCKTKYYIRTNVSEWKRRFYNHKIMSNRKCKQQLCFFFLLIVQQQQRNDSAKNHIENIA